jgi:hypothetical protein
MSKVFLTDVAMQWGTLKKHCDWNIGPLFHAFTQKTMQHTGWTWSCWVAWRKRGIVLLWTTISILYHFLRTWWKMGSMWPIRSNHIGLPSHLKNTKAWKRCDQRHIEWAMHDSRSLSCEMWKDKCPILLISTHANPIGFSCMPHDEVPHRNRAVREKIPTSPMFLGYTTFMRGIDVAD